jgi:type IV pilus assembly protein PilF
VRIGVRAALAWAALVAVGLALAGCGTGAPTQPSAPKESAAASARERARIHTELGVSYYESGKLGIALEELKEAIAADRSYAPAWNARAIVYMELKEDDQAQRDFKQALKLEPNSSETKNNYGLFLCQRNRTQEGIRYILDAIKNPLYETPDVAYKNAALCALNAGEKDTAEQYFLMALKINARQPQSLYNMAALDFARDRYSSAKQHLVRYVQVVESPGPEALLLGARIERRLGDRAAMLSYGNQLRLRFPSSPETKAFLEGRF